MPITEISKTVYKPYLEGGGEMGELTRSFNWAETVLGEPENWSPSLLTTISIILNSKFPMFLWWGPELIQFYNDAFKPSLGNNGEHSQALGQRGEDCWEENWQIIKPLIDQVISTGEATWSEDQLVPMHRNNNLEDVYWTFGYSKVIDDSGKTAGVLVICTETTKDVLSRRKSVESFEKQAASNKELTVVNEGLETANEVLEVKNISLAKNKAHFRNLLLHAPVAIAIFTGPDFIIELANEKVLEYWGRTLEQVINKPLFTALPEASGQGFEERLTNVLQTGEPFIANELPVTLFRNGKLGTTWINFIYDPIRDVNGHITGIMVVCTEITEQVNARKAIEQAEERLRFSVDSAKMGTWRIAAESREFTPSPRLKEIFGFYRDEEMPYELSTGLISKEYRDQIMTEVENAILTGTPYDKEYSINRFHDGKLRWIKATGKLYPPEQDKPAHFSGTIMDITDRKVIDQQKDESLKDGKDLLQSVLDTSLISMSVLKVIRNENGIIQDFSIRLVNKELERETGRNDLIGKLYSVEYPHIKEIGIYDMLLRVVESGKSEQMEYYYKGIDKWFSCMFVKLDDGLVATNLDITARKLAELEKLKNLTILQQAEQVAKLGSWDYELQTTKFSWSDGMYSLFNIEKDKLIVPEIYQQYATLEDLPVANRIVNAIRSGTVDFEETMEIIVDNNRKTIKVKATVIHNAEGQPERVVGVDMDLTEQVKLQEEKKQLEASQNEKLFRTTLDTQEQERKRIAESLHNTLGQLLFSVKISMSHLDVNGQFPDNEELVNAKQYTEQLLADAIRECRRISHELSPVILEDFGLKEAIKDLCRQVSEILPVNYKFTGVSKNLSKYMETIIYRTIQELVMNIIKHAHATKANIEIETVDQAVILTVQDNGIGFNEDNKSNGIGLKMIKSKLKLLNGKFNLTSGDENIISISIPYEND